MTSYPEENSDEFEDCGVMPGQRDTLAEAVVGHKIVKVERDGREGGLITLDNGKRVRLEESSDCCAFTYLDEFLLHPDKVDHIITGVGTTDGFTKWHIYADMGDVLELKVAWSAGNPFYYGYGFYITVEDAQ